MIDAMTSIDRRKKPRYVVELDVIVELTALRTLRGKSRDISESGIFVQLGEPVALEQAVQLTIENTTPGQTIVLCGVVVHALVGLGIGVQFDEQMAGAAREPIRALITTLGRDR